MRSERESSSLPKSLLVPVSRATRPSIPSRRIDAAMQRAANSYWPCIDFTRDSKPKNRLTDVRTLGREAPRRNLILPTRRLGKGASTVCHESRLRLRQDRTSAPNAATDADRRCHARRKMDFDSRAELDEADSFSPLHGVSRHFPANDTPGDHARDLHETHPSQG